jgi:hypothetical protein
MPEPLLTSVAAAASQPGIVLAERLNRAETADQEFTGYVTSNPPPRNG